MDYFIKASAVLGIFYFCYKIFLQRETFFNANRWFLLAGLIVASFLPLLVIPIYIEYTPITIPDNLFTTNQIDDSPNNTIGFIQIISYIYVAGFLFFLGKLFIEFTSLFSLIRNNEHKKDTRFTFIEIENNVPPFSFFNWIVYNPNQFQEQELTHIMNHEKVHAKQYHSIDVLLAQFCCVVFWFNPLCWFYKKELQQNLEFIADLNAQDISNCEQSYQRLLLKTSIPNHTLVITNNFYNSLIKKRIIMLHKSKSNKLNAWKFGIILPLLALFLMSFNTKEVYINTSKSDMNNASENILTKDLTEIVIITKDFADAQLEKVKNQLLKEGLTVKFKGIKRNASGEILAIKIDISSKETSANYNINGDEPINPIKISFNKNGNNISIGSASIGTNNHKMAFITEDGNVHKIKSDGQTENVFVFSSDDHEIEEEIEIKSNGKMAFITEDGNVHKIKSDGQTENVFVFSSDDHEIEEEIESKGKMVFVSDNGDVHTLKNDNKTVKFITISEDGKELEIKSDDNSKSKKIWITKDKISDNENEKTYEVKIISSDGNDEDLQFITKDSNANQKVKVIKLKEKNGVFITNDGGTLLFILDGKEITKEEMEKVNPDIIANVYILKGDKAIEKYGDKAKDGVVVITTKK